jgi:hypothetical protein
LVQRATRSPMRVAEVLMACAAGIGGKEGNIRIEVVGDASLCAAIVDRLRDNYEQDYGLMMFTTPVEVMDQERSGHDEATAKQDRGSS